MYILLKREPFILRDFDLGPCLNKWSVDYLKKQIGQKSVKIHVSAVSDMDFLRKNFLYRLLIKKLYYYCILNISNIGIHSFFISNRSLPFDEFIRRASLSEQSDEYFIDNHEKYYLRSLGSDERKDAANIKEQYPELSEDILFPPLFEPDQFFSSVFRISSAGLRLWTHYDIMDNVLIQVSGKKRVILFPPSEIDYLYMKGDKSQVLNVESLNETKYPLFSKAKRFDCILDKGDSLFIPGRIGYI
jgi:tRNA wybutosine-synthesizing protein 5